MKLRFRGHGLLTKLVIIGILLDLAISGVLYHQNTLIQNNQARITHAQQASNCWNRVLVVALHDQLTPAKRAALIKQATHCAILTAG